MSTAGSIGNPTTCGCEVVVNLRHYRGLSRDVLWRLPPGVDQLLIGPSFDTTSLESVRSIIRNLPPHLSDLDLDLTQVVTSSHNDDHIEASTAPTESHHEQSEEFLVMKGYLSDLFERVSNLRSLSLRLPRECADCGAIAVAAALNEAKGCNRHPQVELLDLRECPMHDPGIVALSGALKSSSIKGLVVSWSSITSKGVGAMAAALKCNPPLESLVLGCMDGLDDESVQELISSLVQNSTLTDLSLFCCKLIGESSGRRLLRCLTRRNTSLERISLKGTKISPSCQNMIEYYLRLNRAGRRYVIGYDDGRDRLLDLSLWPYILEKQTLQVEHRRRTDECHSPAVRASVYQRLKLASATMASESTVSSFDVVYFFLANKAADLLMSA